jgi:hypothetical protein
MKVTKVLTFSLLALCLWLAQPLTAIGSCLDPHIVDEYSESSWNGCPDGFSGIPVFFILAQDHYSFGSTVTVAVRDCDLDPRGCLSCGLKPDGYEVKRAWGTLTENEQPPYYTYSWYRITIGYVHGEIPNTTFFYVNERTVSGCQHTWGSPIIVAFQPKVEFTSPENGANFDIQQYGFPQRVAWIPKGAKVAWLVRGTNITSSAQMFGNRNLQPAGVPKEEANGYLALSLYDADHDGEITECDPIWQELGLWFDDGDAVANPEEVVKLTDPQKLMELTGVKSGVAGISLTYQTIGKRDPYKTAFRFGSSVRLWEGPPQRSFDVIPAVISSTAGTSTQTVTRSGSAVKTTGMQIQ